MKGRVELDSSHKSDSLARLEVSADCCNEVLDVDADGHEDVECLNAFCGVYRYQAAVTIVYQHIAAKSTSGVVIDTAGAVSDIAHDQCVCAGAELSEDI